MPQKPLPPWLTLRSFHVGELIKSGAQFQMTDSHDIGFWLSMWCHNIIRLWRPQRRVWDVFFNWLTTRLSSSMTGSPVMLLCTKISSAAQLNLMNKLYVIFLQAAKVLKISQTNAQQASHCDGFQKLFRCSKATLPNWLVKSETASKSLLAMNLNRSALQGQGEAI